MDNFALLCFNRILEGRLPSQWRTGTVAGHDLRLGGSQALQWEPNHSKGIEEELIRRKDLLASYRNKIDKWHAGYQVFSHVKAVHEQ